MPDYAEHTETIQVGAGPGQEFSHRFPVPGSVRVSAQPYALVLLDGKELGFTPVRVERVSEGEHVLVLEREGFERIEQTIVVKPFEVKPVPVRADADSLTLRAAREACGGDARVQL